MTRPRTLSLLLALLVLCPSGASAYKRAAVEGKPGTYLFWQQRRIDYYINNKGYSGVPINEVVGAVKRAFFAWASPSCTDLYFDFLALTPSTATNLTLTGGDKPDLKNTIQWHAVWPPKGANDGSLTSDMVSLTTLIYVAETGEIADADIDLNGHTKFWTTTDDTTKAVYDIQSVLTHEVGHLLGLGFSDNTEAVLYSELREGDLSKRTLHQDDIEGLCFVYPYEGTTPTGGGNPVAPPQIKGAAGCAVAGDVAHGTVPMLLLLLACGLIFRRRR